MTLREGDKVVIKPHGRAAFTIGDGLVKCNYYKELEAADHLVVRYLDSDGEVGVTASDPEHADGLVSRNQLLRLFPGNYREGDRVYIEAALAYGTVVDMEPVSSQIDRDATIPVRIDSVPPSITQRDGLTAGSVTYVEPEFVRKAVLPPGVVVGSASVVALGGQGGAGGSASGDGAQGGQGGRGGSVYITTAHDNAGVNRAASQLGLEVEPKPKVEPKLVDVTSEVTWKTLQEGDIVTAEHKTRYVGRHRIHYGSGVGQEATVARTSTVVNGYWCELELGLSSYDAYKITKVMRVKPPRLLSARRKPIELTVLRLVPPRDMWSGSTLSTKGVGVVEPDKDGHYWLHFTGGDHAGKRLRLKVGRDKVSYRAIQGTYVASNDFEPLVTATHDPE